MHLSVLACVIHHAIFFFTMLLKKKEKKKEEKRLGMKCQSYFSIKLLPTCDILMATLFPHHMQASYLRYFSGDVVSHYMQASYLRYFSGGASGFSSGSGLGMLSVSGLTDC